MPSYSREVSIPGKTSQELYDRVQQDIEKFMSKSSVGSFDVERDPGQKRVSVKSSMVTATLHCEDGRLRLDAKLSLLAAPFRSKIDEGINRWLSKTFNVTV